MENYYYLCFCANALHLTLRVRLLAMSAAFDFRKCKRLLLSSLAVSALYRGPREYTVSCGVPEFKRLGSLPLETDSFNSGTGEFTRKVERQRVAVQDVVRANLFAQRTLTDKKITQSFDCVILVDVNGLEPLTFSTSRRHSTS